MLTSGRRVVQADDGEYETKTEKTFALITAFLSGFKAEESFPSAIECFNYLELSILMLNETRLAWAELESDHAQAYIFDSAYWVSYSLGPSSRYCFMVGMEGYAWGYTKADVYDGFVDGFLAWL